MDAGELREKLQSDRMRLAVAGLLTGFGVNSKKLVNSLISCISAELLPTKSEQRGTRVYINGIWFEGVSAVHVQPEAEEDNVTELHLTLCDEKFQLFLDDLDIAFFAKDSDKLEKYLGCEASPVHTKKSA